MSAHTFNTLRTFSIAKFVIYITMIEDKLGLFDFFQKLHWGMVPVSVLKPFYVYGFTFTKPVVKTGPYSFHRV